MHATFASWPEMPSCQLQWPLETACLRCGGAVRALLVDSGHTALPDLLARFLRGRRELCAVCAVLLCLGVNNNKELSLDYHKAPAFANAMAVRALFLEERREKSPGARSRGRTDDNGHRAGSSCALVLSGSRGIHGAIGIIMTSGNGRLDLGLWPTPPTSRH